MTTKTIIYSKYGLTAAIYTHTQHINALGVAAHLIAILTG